MATVKSNIPQSKYDDVNKRRALSPVKVTYSSSNESFKVFPIGNLYIGSNLLDVAELKAYVEKIKKTENAVVLIMGNLLDKNVVLNNIKNELLELKSEGLVEILTPEQKALIKILMPIKDKIVVAIRGKEEYEITNSTDIDPLKVVFDELGIKDKYVGDTFLLQIKNSNKNFLNVYGTNGSGENTSPRSKRVKDSSAIIRSLMQVANKEYGNCNWYLSTGNGMFAHIEDAKDFLDRSSNEIINKTRRFTCIDGWTTYDGKGATNEDRIALVNQKIFEWNFVNGNPTLIRHDYVPAVESKKKIDVNYHKEAKEFEKDKAPKTR